MSIGIQCPECGGKLRIGDHSLGKKVKCPKCKAIFTAEEEIEEVEEVEEVERPTRRRREEDYAEEDDRPRRKRRSDDAYVDEDDRPTKPAGNPREMLAWARRSVQLLWIGSIVTLSAVSFRVLLQILFVSEAWSAPDWVRLLLVGLPGLAGVTTFTTGLVFSLLGPKKGAVLGLAIALVAVGGLHLLFTIIAVIPQERSIGGIQFSSSVGGNWYRGATTLPAFSEAPLFFDALHFIAGLFEVATLVLMYLWVRALMLYYKKGASAGQCIAGICITGGVPVFILLLSLINRSILYDSKPSLTTIRVMVWSSFLVSYLAVIAVWVFALITTLGVGSFLEDQKPK
jgi:predicted Zn finger-like uncharacterized protein